jgi:hypothetical protein
MGTYATAEVKRTGGRLGSYVLVVGALMACVTLAIGQESRSKAERFRTGIQSFTLFSSPTLTLAGNQLQCGLRSTGFLCTPSDFTQFSHGGYWPTGTQNGYIFGSGSQIAGINSEMAGPWAGDTVGAYFYSNLPSQLHGTPLTDIYDSLDPDDLENWPAEAYVSDEEVFSPILLGRKSASQQDSWVQYWDADPLLNPGRREHPMGIKVTQRSLSWTYPSGNESTVYFILEFENVTDDPEFQAMNEALFFGGDDLLPDSGWMISEIYVSLMVDPDIGFGGDYFGNYTTAILPFDMGIGYHGGFAVQGYTYPPSVFYPPFFTNAPGIAGIKYLRSPIDPSTGREVGLTLFSVMSGFAFIDPFPNPLGEKQLWRYLSGNLDTALGDPTCTVVPEIDTGSPATTERSLCYSPDLATDVYFFQASGPFGLAPGEAATIVAAYMVGPTVETMPDGSPSGIIVSPANINANPPGIPSFHPGFDSSRGCDVNGQNCSMAASAAENEVKTIERGAGWIRYEGPPPSGPSYPPAVEHPSNKIDQFDVRVVPGSLLGRALVAQTVFDSGFLLGFAPEPPPFYLVPGDNEVTVIWEASATEDEGDPFYDLASDTLSALYNPNYRQFDVEGYRIWRGTFEANLELVAQFDYADTEFFDHTCETVHSEEDVGAMAISTETGNLIPVIGYAAGEICPFDVDNPIVRVINSQMVFNNGSPGGPPGGGVSSMPRSASIDTVIVSDRENGPTAILSDTGVPFIYTDRSVVNNFTYFYSVSAFDVNSMTSGPHTLRSVQVSKTVTPRATNTGLGVVFEASSGITGDDGEPLDVSQDAVQPDPDTGIFPGPQPPSNALTSFLRPDPAEVAHLLSSGSRLTGVIDSVTVEYFASGCEETQGNPSFGMCWKLYTTFDNGTEQVQTVAEGATPVWEFWDGVAQTEFPIGTGQLPFGDAELERYGIPAGSGEGVVAGISGVFQQSFNYSSFEGQSNRRQGSRGMPEGTVAGGSRWFNGANETLADPTTFTGVGHLAEVDSVWAPIHHTPTGPGEEPLAGSGQIQCFGYLMAFLGRAADVRFTWGGGTLSEVRDVTHHVPVPFQENPSASWGFLNTDGNGNGVLDWHDFDYLDPVREQTWGYQGFCELWVAPDLPPPSILETTPTLQPVYLGGGNPLIIDEETGEPDPMPATGNGFGLYVNGERYLFLTDQLPPDGTEWTLRTYTGTVLSDGSDTADPSNYRLTPGGNVDELIRPPLIPGLRFTAEIDEAGQQMVGAFDLSEVHAVPDPYLATSRYDRAPTTKKFMFVNLPPRATLRIYTLTGILVDIVEHDDPSGGGRAEWDLRNRNNQFVGSGVYFFHVVTPDQEEHVGKFTVVIGTGRS